MKTLRTYTLSVDIQADTIDSGAELLRKMTTQIGLGGQWKHTPTTRTNPQNNVLYLGYNLWATNLNKHGVDMRMLLRDDLPIVWTATGVKEKLWLPVMKQKTGKTSTAKLNTKEVSEVYKALADGILKKTNGQVILSPFPSENPYN